MLGRHASWSGPLKKRPLSRKSFHHGQGILCPRPAQSVVVGVLRWTRLNRRDAGELEREAEHKRLVLEQRGWHLTDSA